MTDEFLAAIGRVCVEFSSLEMHIEAAIWSLLVGTKIEDQPTGKIVTADLSFQKALHLYAALFRHRFSERDDSGLRAVCAQASGVEQERNVIIHSTWWHEGDGKFMRVKTTARGELKTKFEKLTASDVNAIARGIHQAAEEVMNFHIQIFDPGSPRLTL